MSSSNNNVFHLYDRYSVVCIVCHSSAYPRYTELMSERAT